MIRSLYVRTVGIFIIVVVLSAVLSFFISGLLIQRDAPPQPEGDMLIAGYYAIQLMKETNVKNPDSYIERFATLQHFIITVYNDKGELRRYGNVPDSNREDEITPDELSSVLKGETYQRPKKKPDDPGNLLIGLPFQMNGENRAMIIQLNFKGQKQQIDKMVMSVLLNTLALGGLMILIASRYLVRPLTKLTEATRKLATGDFNVQVKLKRKDEIGFLADSFNHMAEELRQLEQMRQDFVANVSHEIQTPLTSIRGFSKAIREGLVEGEDKDRCLGIIQEECDRLSRLVENLLRLASLESEHHPFKPVRFDLAEQLRMALLTSTPLLEQKRLALELDLPKTKIVADKDQLYQVWVNLLQNSIKFTPEGGCISVRVSQGGGFAEVQVRDTGIGIPPEDIEHVFDRFYKADKSRDASREGSGLGLAIVKKIVEIHRGTIGLDSKPGDGTVFTVKLPAV
ncbi:HAMP domain-containing sensor histidine kinase [Paenibacillus hamazuiensis]|uniref:HAMP domain-containing sensor histidine kinase n=1 Tax=Paenibacillus hamazuiensis TaxID=2936508 RepID=UPI0020101988|nr:HAMP domain-containing sensor histidine kinase [Paenibacillus hamazuiensis]